MAAHSPVRVAAAEDSAGLRLRAHLLCRGGFPARERRLEVSRSLPDFVTSRAGEMVHRDELDPCGYPTSLLLVAGNHDSKVLTSGRTILDPVSREQP